MLSIRLISVSSILWRLELCITNDVNQEYRLSIQLLLMCDLSGRKPHKKLKNLNWLIDSYQHIPRTFNQTQKDFNRDQPDKNCFILYELTRLQPNQWVEQKPPAKLVEKQEIKKTFDIGIQLKLKKYSSRPQLKKGLAKRQQKLKKQIMKLSSINKFDEQLSKSCYSRKQKKILSAVKNNAIKSITQRSKISKVVERQSANFKGISLDTMEQQIQNMYRKTLDFKSTNMSLSALQRTNYSFNHT